MKELMKMSGRVLLDTNIIIALFNGDTGVIEKIEKIEEIFVPIIVIGELYYGANNSTKKQRNLKRIDDFKAEVDLLNCNEETSRNYGEIKSELKRQGTPIPENDIWIAAIARQFDLTVITRDSHFEKVQSISIESW